MKTYKTSLIIKLAIAAVVGVLAFTQQAYGQGCSCYLKIDGIEGASTNVVYPNWIDVISFGHGADNDDKLVTFVFRHNLDKATPKLQCYGMTGKGIDSAELRCVALMGGADQCFYEVDMKNVKILSAEVMCVDSKASNGLVEEVKMTCEQIMWTIHTFKSTGVLSGDVYESYSIES